MRSRYWFAGGLSLLLTAGWLSVSQALPSNPLRVLTRTQWPSTVTTVGTAARWLLTPIGYRLVLGADSAPDSEKIAARIIDPAALAPQTLPIEDALLAVAGRDTVVYVDHEHRLVAFGFADGATEK
jgi:hypothetical protein